MFIRVQRAVARLAPVDPAAFRAPAPQGGLVPCVHVFHAALRALPEDHRRLLRRVVARSTGHLDPVGDALRNREAILALPEGDAHEVIIHAAVLAPLVQLRFRAERFALCVAQSNK